jgi:hypothetical protein
MEKFRNQRQNFSASAACLRGKLWAKALGRSLTTQRNKLSCSIWPTTFTNLPAGFRSAARLRRSTFSGTIFAQLGKLAA